MRILSKPEERISSKLNSVLSSIIPIIYGAVFSYSMFVLSRILLSGWNIFNLNGTSYITFKLLKPLIESLLVFASIIVFMIQDIGSIFKLANSFPYKRTSRYTYEMWIASSYVAVFAFLEINSYVTIIIFSFSIILSGLWCNQFKEEYKGHPTNIHNLIETERDIFYTFGVIFIFEAAFFIFFFGVTSFNLHTTLTFMFTEFLFLTILTFLPFIKHGDKSLDYTVNVLFPDFFFKKLETVFINKAKRNN